MSAEHSYHPENSTNGQHDLLSEAEMSVPPVTIGDTYKLDILTAIRQAKTPEEAQALETYAFAITDPYSEDSVSAAAEAINRRAAADIQADAERQNIGVDDLLESEKISLAVQAADNFEYPPLDDES